MLVSLGVVSCTHVTPVGQLSLPVSTNDLLLATWSPNGASGSRSSTVGVTALMFDDSCVYLVFDDQRRILPVWPEPTSWDAATQAILFASPEGEQFELREGAQILPGGSSPSGAIQFESPPAPACEVDEMFIISSVTLVQE